MDTIFEIDDIEDTQQQEDKPKKKEPKIKKKKEMSEERKQKLRDQLSRGRKTLADKRAKKKAEKQAEKQETKKEDIPQPTTEPKEIKKEIKKDDDYLRNEISELKKLIMEGRKEPKIETPIKQEPIKEKIVEKPKDKLIQVVETPKLISVPIPIPKKKKRSILGGGMVLNLDRF